jgi:hypothetical protein
MNRTPENEIQEYFAKTDLVSQSELKYFLHPSTFEKYVDNLLLEQTVMPDLYYSEKEAMTIGTGADMLFTRGEEVFNEYFYVSDLTLPGAKIISMCHYIFDKILWQVRNGSRTKEEVSTNLSDYPDLISEAIEKEAYYPTYKEETKIKKLIEEGDAYFSLLIAARGKQVIDNNTFETIKKVKDVYTLGIGAFLNLLDLNLEDTVITFQKPYYSILIDTKVKCLLDVHVFDIKTGYTYIIDLKYTSDYLINFKSSIKRFRYDIQSVFYKDIVGKDENVPKIYILAVSGKNFAFNLFEIEDELLNLGRDGSDSRYKLLGVGYDFLTEEPLEIDLPNVVGYKALLSSYKLFQEYYIRCESEDAVKELKTFLDDKYQFRKVGKEVFYKL